MKTVDILLKKYGDKFIPVSVAMSDYYGISTVATAEKYARTKRFPELKAFKAGTNWLVDIENLADALDSKARASR